MLSEEEKATAKKQTRQREPVNWTAEIMKVMALLLAVLLLVMATPYVIYRYLKWKGANSRDQKQKLYYQYTSAMFFLHQMGHAWQGQTPFTFARNSIDAQYGTRFAPFVQAYQKAKYAPQPLTSYEQVQVDAAWPETMQMVAEKLTAKHRFLHFININRAIAFFRKPEVLA